MQEPERNTCMSFSSFLSSVVVAALLHAAPTAIKDLIMDRALRWAERWSLRAKDREQTSHTYGREPVCLRRWRVSSSERAKRQSQPGQVQWKGRSPVWVRAWALRCDDLV